MFCTGFFSGCLSQRSFFVDVLCVLLGLNSQITTNGLWNEVPLMVGVLPERWKLGSYLSVIIQVANIGPILYTVVSWRWPQQRTETIAIYVMLFIGTSGATLLSLFWSKTMWVAGEEHSIALFSCTFLLALVDSMSSVVCFPFMSRLRPCYVTSYMIGEALGGFIPSLVALIQGVEDYTECRNVTTFNESLNETRWNLEPIPPNPHFPPEVFFGCLAGIMSVSAIGFLFLHWSPQARIEYVTEESSVQMICDATGGNTVTILPAEGVNTDPTKTSFNSQTLLLLAVYTWVTFLGYGALPNIQSYSCLPYGSDVFLLAVILASAATPVSCFISLVLPTRRAFIVLIVAAIGTLISMYCLSTAILSPSPPLVGQTVGKSLVIVSWMLSTGLFGYVKIMVAAILAMVGHRALYWSGALCQVGSSFGALLMFLLVTVEDVFKEDRPC